MFTRCRSATISDYILNNNDIQDSKLILDILKWLSVILEEIDQPLSNFFIQTKSVKVFSEEDIMEVNVYDIPDQQLIIWNQISNIIISKPIFVTTVTKNTDSHSQRNCIDWLQFPTLFCVYFLRRLLQIVSLIFFKKPFENRSQFYQNFTNYEYRDYVYRLKIYKNMQFFAKTLLKSEINIIKIINKLCTYYRLQQYQLTERYNFDKKIDSQKITLTIYCVQNYITFEFLVQLIQFMTIQLNRLKLEWYSLVDQTQEIQKYIIFQPLELKKLVEVFGFDDDSPQLISNYLVCLDHIKQKSIDILVTAFSQQIFGKKLSRSEFVEQIFHLSLIGLIKQYKFSVQIDTQDYNQLTQQCAIIIYRQYNELQFFDSLSQVYENNNLKSLLQNQKQNITNIEIVKLQTVYAYLIQNQYKIDHLFIQNECDVLQMVNSFNINSEEVLSLSAIIKHLVYQQASHYLQNKIINQNDCDSICSFVLNIELSNFQKQFQHIYSHDEKQNGLLQRLKKLSIIVNSRKYIDLLSQLLVYYYNDSNFHQNLIQKEKQNSVIRNSFDISNDQTIDQLSSYERKGSIQSVVNFNIDFPDEE